MRYTKAIGIVTLCVFLLAGLFAVVLYKTNFFRVDTFDSMFSQDAIPRMTRDRENSAVGVDISRHQLIVSFKNLSEEVDFVIIRSSLGSTGCDDWFKYNAKYSSKTNLKVGYYHLFKFDQDGETQALNFMRTIADYRYDLPLAIDFETHQEKVLNGELTVDQVRKNLSDMIEYLRSNGYRVMIYANMSDYAKYLENYFDDVDLWLASYRHPNFVSSKFKLMTNYKILQFSDHGSVRGIISEVDLNIFNGSKSDFEKWLDID